MSVTATIQELLQGIMDSQYGRDMRQFIHDAIQKCYEEGSAGETDLVARERLDDVEATLTESLADMQESIDEGLASGFANIAPVETTTTASQAYAVGDYFMYNGKLYKVTTAIISGGAIQIGTNAVESVMAESMQKSDAVGTNYFTNFAPSTHTGTQTGTPLVIGAGTFLIIEECRLPSSGACNATFTMKIQTDGSSHNDDMTLTNSDWHYSNTSVYEFTDPTTSITPVITFNSGGTNVTFPYLTLTAVRIK